MLTDCCKRRCGDGEGMVWMREGEGDGAILEAQKAVREGVEMGSEGGMWMCGDSERGVN